MASSDDAPGTRSQLHGLVRALRPRQWAKNVLVFAAPVAAGAINHGSTIPRALLAFVAFCLASSGTYLFNDARDVESDRMHPVKRNRPIAAGIIAVDTAYAIGGVLVIVALAIGFATARNLGLTILTYVGITTAYSFGLKRIAIVDIVTVAAGFVLRAIAGASATSVPISEWFFIVTSFGALLVVTGKREGELNELGGSAGEVRATLAVYTPDFLRYLRSVSSGVVLVAYCLWAFESAARARAGSLWFQLSIVPFAVAIFQYALILDRGEGEHPDKVLTSNRAMLISGALWAIIYASAVYLT